MPRRNIGQEIIDGLTDVRDTLRRGIPLRERFDVRQITVPEPSRYGPAQIKRTRSKLGVSQPVFASLLGISAILEKSWEQGRRRPNPMARRLLDEINHEPLRWANMLQPRKVG